MLPTDVDNQVRRTICCSMIWLLLCSTLAARANAECATTSSLGADTYYGRLADGRLFGVTLEIDDPNASAVKGRFFVAPDYRDVEVKGTIANRTVLRLDATNDGRVVFEGIFVDTYLERRDLTCDVILGNAGGVAAVLNLEHIGPTSIDLTPELATTNAAALEVLRAISADNSTIVANHIRFPLRVWDVRRSHTYFIKNRADFLRAYPRLIDSKFKAGILSEVPHDLFGHNFGSYLAFGMARGRIWFDDKGDGKISAMNVGW
jgi:hypothetical protein